MNWIMDNLDIVSSVAFPLISFLVGIALKQVKDTKWRKKMLKVVQMVEEKMIEADYLGDKELTHNDVIKEEMDKIKIDLGAGK